MRYTFGECELDVGCYELQRRGEVVPLGPKVFEVLLYLIRHRQRVVSKQELFDTLWPGQFVSDASLTRCIAAARRAIVDGSGQAMIKTQYGRGYRFMPEVAVCDVAPSHSSVPGNEPAEAAPASTPVEADGRAPSLGVDDRKQVTALSCRLGQLEALSAALPPEALHNLLHGFFERAARRVAHYDGTITQFTSDGFMALFGVPVAHEDHAQRALLVATELQHSLRQDCAGEGLPSPLTLHIGMHTGEVVGRRIAERQTVTYLEVGDTLRLATKLQQLAPAGALLLSAASAPRVEHAARLEVYAGGHESHGNGATVAYRVCQVDPRRLGVLRVWQRRLSRFVGRESELAALHALLARVERGQGQVVGLVGEAGLGKSRLLYEFRRRLQGRPHTYLRGQCLSYGQATPYQPLRDLLRRHCRIADADAPEAISDKLRRWFEAVGLDVDAWLPHLLALVDIDVLSEALSRLSPQARRARTIEALVRLVLASSRQAALIVEIENLHWMDASSEDYLTLLVERLAGAPVLLLLSYRPGYALPWTGKSYVSVLPLSPLDPAASRQVVENASDPAQLPPQVLDEIVTRGDGNPFFLEELGVAVKQQDRRSPPQVPETVQLVLAARLDRLPAAAKRLLQTAAVTCNEAALAIDRQRDDSTAMATDLTNLGAVLRNIGNHERALACLEEALHLHETARNPVKQAFTLHSIANVHRELGATGCAMTAYQQAYDIFVQHHDLVMASRSLAGMAHLHWEQGDTGDSRRLYEEVLRITRDSHHGHNLAHTLRTLGDCLLTLNEPEQALPYFLESTDVFAELGDAESEAEVWGKLAAIYEQSLADDQQAFAAWEKALALRKQVVDRGGALEALQQMGRLARQRLGKPARALLYFRQALDLAMALGDRAKQGELLNTLGIMAWQQGAYADALGHYEQALRIYRETADAAHTGLILNSLGATLHRLQRYDEALVRLQEAVAVNRQANQRLLEGHGLAVMGDVYRALDRYEQALEHYQASLTIRREIGDRKGEGWMLYALAVVYAAQDAPAKAHDCALEALAIAQECNDAELRRVCTSWQD